MKIIFFFFCLTTMKPLWASPDAFAPQVPWLQQELTRMKLGKSFIREALENYETDTFESVMKLNLLGFLQPSQHMERVTPQSVERTLQFLKEHEKAFGQAQKKYKVPPAVVSALLWIETRHGDDKGRFHVLSVYLHLLQANRSVNRKILTSLALDENKKNKQFKEKELKKIMSERTKKRAQWAREQIRALSQSAQKKKLDLKTLRGSFAGAFGLPQFIPSSYRDFARSMNPQTSADLYSPPDAILSVASYLRRHGWSNGKTASQISALMKYNNSRDYADSILEISKRASASSSGR